MKGQALSLHMAVHHSSNVFLSVCRNVREWNLSDVVHKVGAKFGGGVNYNQDIGRVDIGTTILQLCLFWVTRDVVDDFSEDQRVSNVCESGGKQKEECENSSCFDEACAFPQERESEREKLSETVLF